MVSNTEQGLPLGATLHKGPQDEDEDYEHNVQSMLDQEFDDWPNEAGVSYPLICMHDQIANV